MKQVRGTDKNPHDMSQFINIDEHSILCVGASTSTPCFVNRTRVAFAPIIATTDQ